MSNLSELLPTGGGQNAVEFVASGTLASGQTVALKTDGTVEAIASDAISVPQAVGASSVYESANSQHNAVAYDSTNNKLLIVYRDAGNSNYGTAVVATLSGSTLTYGTPVVFYSGSAADITIVYSSTADKFVISWNQSGGRSIVGTVSGTTVSFGSQNQWSSNNLAYTVSAYDSENDKIVALYQDGTQSDYGYARVGTVSGTSISFGTEVQFANVSVFQIGATYDSVNKKVIVVYGNSTSGLGQAKVGTVSGTSISWGNAATYGANEVTRVNVAACDVSQNKIFVAYRESASVFGIIGTVSGTSISFGTRDSLLTASTALTQTVTYHAAAQAVVFSTQQNNNELRAIICTVSGTTFSKSSAILLANTGDNVGATYDSKEKQVVTAYRDTGNSDYGTAITITPAYTASNSTSFIGITAEAISNTATGAINTYGGINTVQTGLTIASDYYVQTDGSLGSPTVSAPYVIVGATYVQNFSVATQETSPRAMAFNTDGTKMFVIGDIGDDVNEYALSTGFDVSTASYTQAFSIAAQETTPSGIAFNTDGTKMFVVGTTGDAVNEYALSTGFNVSTASFTDSFSVAPQETSPQDVAFNTDGTKMFVVGDTGDDINEYTLATGFDVSTSSFVDSFSVSAQEAAPQGVAFNPDGTKMFVVGNAAGEVHQYTLTTGFDVSTASYASINFSAAAQDTFPMGIAFNTDGTKMFIVGLENDAVYQYSTGVGSVTTVKAGQAISATTINMKDLT